MNRRNFIKTTLATLVWLAFPRPGKSAAGKSVPLFSCYVAGFQNYEGPQIISSLRPGEQLTLLREPANPHDGKAIAVYSAAGQKLGYLPAYINEIPALRMDEGQRFVALVKKVDPAAPPWEMLEMTIVGPG